MLFLSGTVHTSFISTVEKPPESLWGCPAQALVPQQAATFSEVPMFRSSAQRVALAKQGVWLTVAFQGTHPQQDGRNLTPLPGHGPLARWHHTDPHVHRPPRSRPAAWRTSRIPECRRPHASAAALAAGAAASGALSHRAAAARLSCRCFPRSTAEAITALARPGLASRARRASPASSAMAASQLCTV